jgi:hypothetical protein
VLVATSLHLGHQLLVPLEECQRLANPALRLRMVRISARAPMHNQDVPEAMQFSVLTQQMLSTELARGYIPDSHSHILTR